MDLRQKKKCPLKKPSAELKQKNRAKKRKIIDFMPGHAEKNYGNVLTFRTLQLMVDAFHEGA